MSTDKYLKNIHSPADIKDLSYAQLNELAAEIRTVLIDTVSKNGGHLASNLGVVELTLAMHKEFDSPRDKFVWDVGHQAYTHKLLTGRYERFHTLRQEGGLSGFCRPEESEHDMFYSGHSSTAASSALGLSTANTMRGSKNTVVAVVGDGSMTGGMFYEALNNAGRTHDRLIIVLNDNEMSISENVGSMARYLAVVRAKPEYYRMKAHTEKLLKHIPLIGNELSDAAFDIKSALKRIIYSDSWFEDLGLHYIGPIDGHNIQQLCEAFEMAKKYDKPVLLHVNTLKGKGYDFAERSPEQFHGISKFDINTGEPLSTGTSFSSHFGDIMCRFASCDDRVCAITAAMSIGTGLERFSNEYKYRFFDIGIAEEHAVAFALGLAKSGFIPVFAVYSTFLQRCFDQLLHDAALQKQKMVIAVDRAGFVGEDGETHQGVFDVNYLRSVPGMQVLCPSNRAELRVMLRRAVLEMDGPVAVRWPRGGDGAFTEVAEKPILRVGSDITMIAYGTMINNVLEAAALLEQRGVSAEVIKLESVKPVRMREITASVRKTGRLLVAEDAICIGCAGKEILSQLRLCGIRVPTRLCNLGDRFVTHGKVQELQRLYGLDAESLAKQAQEVLHET